MCAKIYHSCAVPSCKNTSTDTPEKLFIHVPKQSDIRKKWLKLARRNYKEISAKSSHYFCEDHFDLPNDMENCTQYMLMGVQRVIMKNGCLPKNFECQIDRKRTSATITRPVALKRWRLQLIEEAENFFKAGNSIRTDLVIDNLPSADDAPTEEPISPIEHTSVDKCLQVNISKQFRSKGTQCYIKVQDAKIQELPQ